MRRVVPLIVVMLVGCGGDDDGPAAPTPLTSVSLSFSSTPGDLLARGQSRRFDAGNATFFGGMSDDNRALRVVFRHDGTFTQLMMRALPGQVLTPGVYRNASRSSDPFLDFAYNASSCNNSTGEFQVFEAVYGPNPTGFGGYSGTISRFRATFRQSCGSTPNESITGEVQLLDIPLG